MSALRILSKAGEVFQSVKELAVEYGYVSLEFDPRNSRGSIDSCKLSSDFHMCAMTCGSGQN